MQISSIQSRVQQVIIICCCLQAFAQTAWSQSTASQPPFVKGSRTLGFSAGFGIGYNYISGYSGLPAFALTYDQGFFENIGPGNIGIGGVIAIKTAHYKYAGGSKATWNNYFVGVRGTYHLTLLADKNNKFDPYAGVTLGIRIYRYNDNYSHYTDHSMYPVVGAFVGARYNFATRLGAFAELGYDISFARAGICFTF